MFSLSLEDEVGNFQNENSKKTTWKEDAGRSAVFNESFLFQYYTGCSFLRVKFYDHNHLFANEKLGEARLPLLSLFEESPFENNTTTGPFSSK